MDNSYFVFTENTEVKIKRFHICTWEFKNGTALIEFGCEIDANSLVAKNSIDLVLLVPWYNDKCDKSDLYPQLKDTDNSRFIFNNSISKTTMLDETTTDTGVIHHFSENGELCFLPIEISEHAECQLKIHIDLLSYNRSQSKPDVYIRFWVTPKIEYISTRKKGIGKSVILYDIKLNEKRNLPSKFIRELTRKKFCEVESCFCFNIVPNSYDLVFFDSASIQNVRTLEYESFNKYLGDKRIKQDELIVIFNKKKKDTPFSFFAIYSKERIGPGQYALAIFINFVCGIFLFIPAYRKGFSPELSLLNVWRNLPFEIYLASVVCVLTITILIWPWICEKFPKQKFK